MNRSLFLLFALVAVFSVACKSPSPKVDAQQAGSTPSEEAEVEPSAADTPPTLTQALLAEYKRDPNLAFATFAGGCFWCMETPFEQMNGVKAAISGYAGGEEVAPTYKEVASGQTGHAEVVQIVYDPAVVNYAELLVVFWQQINPTQADGQFVDRGAQYRSAIFYHDQTQRALAERSRELLAANGPFEDEIVTQIEPMKRFWVAEEYHQDFYDKSPRRYKGYRVGSGRDQFIERVWSRADPERIWADLAPRR